MSKEKKTGRERLTELRYQMEKNSFILSIIEARISIILHAQEMGYAISDTAIITRTSTHYVSFVMALRDKYSEQIAPNGLKASSIEELAQIIYDKVYVEDHKYAGQFSRFDTELLDSWFELKQRQEALFDNIIDRQKAQAIFQDAYFQRFGTRVSIREIEQKPEQKKQQETEPEKEPETDEKDFDYFEYYRQETEAKLLCRMYRDGIIDESTALEYIDEPSLTHEDFLRIVDTFAEKEQEERADDNSND